MTFAAFQGALKALSVKVNRSGARSRDEAYAAMLATRILPLAPRRTRKDVAELLVDPQVARLLAENEDEIRLVFGRYAPHGSMHYAGASEWRGSLCPSRSAQTLSEQSRTPTHTRTPLLRQASCAWLAPLTRSLRF